jgi:hypothetical protein
MLVFSPELFRIMTFKADKWYLGSKEFASVTLVWFMTFHTSTSLDRRKGVTYIYTLMEMTLKA